MINQHMTEWLGLPVKFYDQERSASPITEDEARSVAFHLFVDPYGSEFSFAELFSRFISNASVSEATALIIGSWGEVGAGDGSEEVVRLLVGARNQLTSLKGLFLGDLIGEQCEVSWINQTDISPILTAYPNLEHLGIRGTPGLSLGDHPQLHSLKSLCIQTGGMPLSVYRQVAGGEFPSLRRLELWLGTSGYGGEITAEPLSDLLSGKLFPE